MIDVSYLKLLEGIYTGLLFRRFTGMVNLVMFI